MLDWLKPILGDGYNEEIDNKIAAEINKGFVAKADYDAAKDAQRTAAEALARRQQGAGRVQGHRHRRPAQERRGGRPRRSRPKRMRTPALRRYSLMQSWIPLLLPRMGAAARPSVPCSIWTPCAAAKTPTRTFPPRWPRCRRTAAICSTPRKLRRPMLQARAAPP